MVLQILFKHSAGFLAPVVDTINPDVKSADSPFLTFMRTAKASQEQFRNFRSPIVVRTSKPDPRHTQENDPGMYDGVIYLPQTIGRFSFYEETVNTADPDNPGKFVGQINRALTLHGGKVPGIMRGMRGPDDAPYASDKTLKDGYLPFAIKLSSDPREQKRAYRKALEFLLYDYCRENGRRASRHFAITSASYKVELPVSKGKTRTERGEFYANDAFVYELRPTPKGRYDVILHLAARRTKKKTALFTEGDEHFVPFDPFSKTAFPDTHFTHISKKIGSFSDKDDARKALFNHMIGTLSVIWDEKNLFDGQDLGLQRWRAEKINEIYNQPIPPLVSSAVGATLFAMNTSYGLSFAALYAISHVLYHGFLHGSIHGSLKKITELREEMKKTNLGNYSGGERCEVNMQQQTIGNTSRRNPKVRADLDGGQFGFLTSADLEENIDHLQVCDDFDVENLGALLIDAPERGFPFIRGGLDRPSEIEVYVNGICAVRRNLSSQKTVIYAQYRPDFTRNLFGLDKSDRRFILSDEYARQFEGGVVKVEYDRSAKSFPEGITITRYNGRVETLPDDITFAPYQRETGNYVQNVNMATYRQNAFNLIQKLCALQNPSFADALREMKASLFTSQEEAQRHRNIDPIEAHQSHLSVDSIFSESDDGQDGIVLPSMEIA